jgi:large repetitive protein
VRELGLLTTGLLFVACGGPSGGQDAGSGSGPRIATFPARVDFGVDAGSPVDVGLVGTATLTIKNSGSGTLTLSSVTLSGDPEFTATRPSSMDIAADAGSDITITFSPMDVRQYSGRITIQSNAKNVPTAGITVMGLGKQP